MGKLYVPGFKLTAVKLFELLHENGLFGKMDGWTDHQCHNIIGPSFDGCIKTMFFICPLGVLCYGAVCLSVQRHHFRAITGLYMVSWDSPFASKSTWILWIKYKCHSPGGELWSYKKILSFNWANKITNKVARHGKINRDSGRQAGRQASSPPLPPP